MVMPLGNVDRPSIDETDGRHLDNSFGASCEAWLEAGMMVRDEADGDREAVAYVTTTAFEGHPYSSGGEAALVESLRAATALTLSLVAEVDGEVVGHIAFSAVTVGEGGVKGWHGLGPLSVRPDRQRRGIGSALVGEGLRRLQDEGAQGCVVVGDPAFYRRFGFETCAGVRLPGVAPEHFLIRWIDGPLPSGDTRYHDAFDEV